MHNKHSIMYKCIYIFYMSPVTFLHRKRTLPSNGCGARRCREGQREERREKKKIKIDC